LKRDLFIKKENWHRRSSASFVEFLKLWSFVRDYLGRIVPPSVAYRVAETLSHLRTQDVISLPNLGHLAHEEQAQWVANVIWPMGQPFAKAS
jgi:hypothetical protein